MRINLTALAFFLFIGTGTAQTPLGFDEALRLGRQNNLQLKKQQQQQKIAEMKVAIKHGQLLPALDFSVTSSYTDEIAKLDIPISQFGLPLID